VLGLIFILVLKPEALVSHASYLGQHSHPVTEVGKPYVDVPESVVAAPFWSIVAKAQPLWQIPGE
jgi:hypothetical protein